MLDVTAARARAMTRMRDTCTITRPAGPPVLDETTLTLVPPPATVVYDGQCSVQLATRASQSSDAEGGADQAVRRIILALPGGTSGPRRGDTVTMTTSGPNASGDLTGRTFEIAEDDPRSRQVRAMYPCEDRHYEDV